MSITAFRTLVAFTSAVCLAAPAAAMGQQPAGATRPAVSMTPAAASSASASVPRPHASPLFEPVDPSNAADRASFLPSDGGGRHTITVSTLALVLGVIILVLLVAR